MGNKEGQIITLLAGDPLGYIFKKLGVTTINKDSFDKVFTVTKEDVIEFVRMNGFPEKSFKSRQSASDGVRFYEKGGKWLFYYQERGGILKEEIFESYEAALEPVVERLLRRAAFFY